MSSPSHQWEFELGDDGNELWLRLFDARRVFFFETFKLKSELLFISWGYHPHPIPPFEWWNVGFKWSLACRPFAFSSCRSRSSCPRVERLRHFMNPIGKSRRFIQLDSKEFNYETHFTPHSYFEVNIKQHFIFISFSYSPTTTSTSRFGVMDSEFLYLTMKEFWKANCKIYVSSRF